MNNAIPCQSQKQNKESTRYSTSMLIDRYEKMEARKRDQQRRLHNIRRRFGYHQKKYAKSMLESPTINAPQNTTHQKVPQRLKGNSCESEEMLTLVANESKQEKAETVKAASKTNNSDEVRQNHYRDLEIELNEIISSLKHSGDETLIEFMKVNRQLIDKKNEEIKQKNIEIEQKNMDIEQKNREITSMTNVGGTSNLKQIEKMNGEIASLKTMMKGIVTRLDMVINPTIDLTSDGDSDSEPPMKRPRVETSTKGYLAIMHEQNQKLVQVKQEKTAIEANLQTVAEEKNAMEAVLEDTKEDLEIANNTVQQQALATDIWQRRFDELATMVTGKVEAAAVAEIRNRSLANQF